MRANHRSHAATLIAVAGFMSTASCGSGSGTPSTDVAAQALRRSAVYPQARGYAHLTYADTTERVLMIGGEASASWGVGLPGLGGAWAFDAGARRWSVLASANPFVADLAAYNSRADRVIAWAPMGVGAPLGSIPQFTADTWALNPHTGEWTNLAPLQSPPAGLCMGCGAQMAYDSKSDKLITFGGIRLPLLFEFFETGDISTLIASASDETWAYDFQSNTWTKMAPPLSPSPRSPVGLAYDKNADRVILFGGGDPFTDFDDTWAYDYNTDTWTELHPATHPSARAYAPLTYDEEAGVTVLFGGVDYTETLLSDETWTFDYGAGTWTQKYPGVSPSMRAWHDIAYSPKANATVLFGGGMDRFSFTDETWEYRSAPDTWIQVPKPAGL